MNAQISLAAMSSPEVAILLGTKLASFDGIYVFAVRLTPVKQEGGGATHFPGSIAITSQT